MATPKLSAPVGLNPRESQGASVKNTTEDVTIVQIMLNANDIRVPINGKIDPATMKGIEDAQRSIAKLKTPDKVIDPGGTSWKALFPKFDAFWKKTEAEAETIKKARADLDKALRKKSKAMYMVLSKYESMYYGLAKSRRELRFGSWLVETFKWIKWPGSGPFMAAKKAYYAYDRAIATGKYKKLDRLCKAADRAIGLFVKSISAYYRAVVSPTWAGTYLSLAKFSMDHILPIVVVTLTAAALTPLLLGAAGLTVATAPVWVGFAAAGSAAAAGGVLTKGIKDLTSAAGKYLAGNKITGYKSISEGLKTYGWAALQGFLIKGPVSKWLTPQIRKVNFHYLLKGGNISLSQGATQYLARTTVNELYMLFVQPYLKGSGKSDAKKALKKVAKSMTGKEKKEQIADRFLKELFKTRGFQRALEAHLMTMAQRG